VCSRYCLQESQNNSAMGGGWDCVREQEGTVELSFGEERNTPLQQHFLSRSFLLGEDMIVEGSVYVKIRILRDIMVYCHQDTGHIVWCSALQIGKPDKDNLVFFHYTSVQEFAKVVHAPQLNIRLWEALKEESVHGRRGVFALDLEPSVLPRRTSRRQHNWDLPRGSEPAPFCIPIIVPRSVAHNADPRRSRIPGGRTVVLLLDKEEEALQFADLHSEQRSRRRIETLQAQVGDYHCETLGVVCSFAFLLQARHRWYEATAYYKYALKGYEDAFGPQHPDVFRILNNLAACLQASGRLDEAEPYAQKAYAGCLAWLGPESEDTLVSHRNLHYLQRVLRRERSLTEDSSREFTDSFAKQSSCGSTCSRNSSVYSSCRTTCTSSISTRRGSKVGDPVSVKDLDLSLHKLGPSTLESIRSAPHFAAVQVWLKKTNSMDTANSNVVSGHTLITPPSRQLGLFDCLQTVLGCMFSGCWIGHQAKTHHLVH